MKDGSLHASAGSGSGSGGGGGSADGGGYGSRSERTICSRRGEEDERRDGDDGSSSLLQDGSSLSPLSLPMLQRSAGEISSEAFARVGNSLSSASAGTDDGNCDNGNRDNGNGTDELRIILSNDNDKESDDNDDDDDDDEHRRNSTIFNETFCRLGDSLVRDYVVSEGLKERQGPGVGLSKGAESQTMAEGDRELSNESRRESSGSEQENSRAQGDASASTNGPAHVVHESECEANRGDGATSLERYRSAKPLAPEMGEKSRGGDATVGVGTNDDPSPGEPTSLRIPGQRTTGGKAPACIPEKSGRGKPCGTPRQKTTSTIESEATTSPTAATVGLGDADLKNLPNATLGRGGDSPPSEGLGAAKSRDDNLPPQNIRNQVLSRGVEGREAVSANGSAAAAPNYEQSFPKVTPRKGKGTPSSSSSVASKRSVRSTRTARSTRTSRSARTVEPPPVEATSLLARGRNLFARTAHASSAARYARGGNDDCASSVISELSHDTTRAGTTRVGTRAAGAGTTLAEDGDDAALERHLEESGLVLLKRLIEFLSECPPAPEELKGRAAPTTGPRKRPRGLTLPASAIGWLSSRSDGSYDAAFNEEGDAKVDRRSTRGVPRQQLECLASLLPRVTSLRVSGEVWPPPSSATTARGTTPSRLEGGGGGAAGLSSKLLSKLAPDSSSRANDDDSCGTGPSSRFGADESEGVAVTPLRRYCHELRCRPNVNLGLFPRATKVVVDGVPPSWVTNLDKLEELDSFQVERGCILDANRLLFPSDRAPATPTGDEGKEEGAPGDDGEDEPTDRAAPPPLAVHAHLSKLRLSNCAMGEAAGLRGRRRRRTRARATSSSGSSAAPPPRSLPPPLSRCPNLVSLDLSRNELFEAKTVFAGLASLPLLSSIDLSYNRLSSMDEIFLHVGNVTELILTGNELSSTRGLDRLFSLERLSLDENRIRNLANVAGIAKLPFLATFDLKDNPLESDDPEMCRVKVFNLFREVRCGNMPKNATFRDMQRLLPVLDGELATKDELVALKDLTFRQTTTPADPRVGPREADAGDIDESSEISVRIPDGGGGARRIAKKSPSVAAHVRPTGSMSFDKKTTGRLRRLNEGIGSELEGKEVKFDLEELMTSLRPKVVRGDASVGAGDEEMKTESLDFNAMEQDSEYDGPSDYASLYPSTDLDLYFDSYVFQCDPSNDDDQKGSSKAKIVAPRIQLFKFDRDAIVNEKRGQGALLASMMDFRERYIGVWKENVLACGSYARSRLAPVKLARRGFHGETISHSGKEVMVSESRKFIVCLSDSALYFIDDDDLSPKTSTGGRRPFPSRVPANSTFADAHWPHAVMRHPLACLQGISIGFQFQRLVLKFSVGNAASSSTLEYAYVILTSNKLNAVSLLQKLQLQTTDDRTGTGASIDNDDKAFLDALGTTRSNEVIVHYQILHRIWKRGDRAASRRSFVLVLTDSNVYLIDETYAGDGSNPKDEREDEALGTVDLSIIDSAKLSRVSEVRAANEDPRKITLVILPQNQVEEVA
ncbi:hypothetical protein ACHAWF_009903 [Thalassiosira exigua]